MAFDIVEYRKSKELVISLIKESHDWENHEGFIADGIISPQTYKNQSVKILVMLGESYGYSHNGMVEIEDQPDHDIFGVGHPKRQTSKKISMLLALIFQSFRRVVNLSMTIFPIYLKTERNTLQNFREHLQKHHG